jgi:hypothetical protein
MRQWGRPDGQSKVKRKSHKTCMLADSIVRKDALTAWQRKDTMGPREALQRIRAIIKDALATDDIEAVHRLLHEAHGITDKALGRGTLRGARLVRH